jgi:hypothetical protein
MGPAAAPDKVRPTIWLSFDWFDTRCQAVRHLPVRVMRSRAWRL